MLKIILPSRITTHFERSERIQLRVCMLKQATLPLKTDVSKLICSMQKFYMRHHNLV